MEKPAPVYITKSLLWRYFRAYYPRVGGREFLQTPESLANLAPIIEYFARDPGFFSRERLVRSVNGQQLRPSFNKGLLIIGGYGNGKTSIMTVLELVFSTLRMPMRFSSYKAREVVSRYEQIWADPTFRETSRYEFYQRFSRAAGLYLDDVKKERAAYHYGKVEVIREILEMRYEAPHLKTYITCNYRESDSKQNLRDGLEEFGEKYGGHIYDRLFEMFNIIEFKGPSLRG